jgi:hypothetical protein
MNEPRPPIDKLNNSHPGSRPQASSRYTEVTGVLVESHVRTNPTEVKTNKKSEVSELVCPNLMIGYPISLVDQD